ncbi:hypothetical protein [Kitasatospora sp. LaBMicrA B282]|uniref:hypothetical protein n=1 Tax=Kitasatospora sp. LaBMicrA B282 TaxID=3420949 RepID=UPI003D1395A0
MRRNSKSRDTPAQQAERVGELAERAGWEQEAGGSECVTKDIGHANRVAQGHPLSNRHGTLDDHDHRVHGDPDPVE